MLSGEKLTLLSRKDGIIQQIAGSGRPNSFTGFCKLLCDKTSTTFESSGIVAYPVLTVLTKFF